MRTTYLTDTHIAAPMPAEAEQKMLAHRTEPIMEFGI